MSARSLLGASAGGITATLVDLGVLTVLVEHGVRIGIAAFFAAVAGASVQFAINKRAFADRTRTTFAQLGRYAMVAVCSALIMAMAMHVFAVKLGVQYHVAKLVCAVLVFVVWTFPAQRRFVFRPITPRVAQPASASLF